MRWQLVPLMALVAMLLLPASTAKPLVVVVGSNAAAADVVSAGIVASKLAGYPGVATVTWYRWVEGFYVVPNTSRNYTVERYFEAGVGGFNAVYIANYTWRAKSRVGVLCFQLVEHDEYEEEWRDGVHWLPPSSENACRYEIHNKGYWLNTEVKPAWLFGYVVKPVYIFDNRSTVTLVLLSPAGEVVDCKAVDVGETWQVEFEWAEENKTWVAVKVERIGVKGVDVVWLTLYGRELPREIKPYRVDGEWYVKVDGYVYPWPNGYRVVVATDGSRNHRLTHHGWVRAELNKPFTVNGKRYILLKTPEGEATLYEASETSVRPGQEWTVNATKTVKVVEVEDHGWEESTVEVTVRQGKVCIEAPAWSEACVRVDEAVKKLKGKVVLVGGPLVNKWVEKLASNGYLPVEIARDYLVANGVKWVRVKGAKGLTNGLGVVVKMSNPYGPGELVVVAGCDRYGTLAAAIGLVRGLARGKVSLFAYTPDPALDGERVGPWILVHPEEPVLPEP